MNVSVTSDKSPREVEVNLGLVNRAGLPVSHIERLARLWVQDNFTRVCGLRVEQSTTEPTLVFRGRYIGADLRAEVHAASVALHQDCIAIRDTATGKGELIGPRADAWGEFNAEFFIDTEPATLSRSSATLALATRADR